MSIAVTYTKPFLFNPAKNLARELHLTSVKSIDSSFSFYLVLTPERLQLQPHDPKLSGPIYVDFVEGKLGHRLKFGGGRRQLIGRAVGVVSKASLSVLDVTAGLGRDAWVLANMGCRVTMVERSSIVAALLEDGLARAAKMPEFSNIHLPLIKADAVQFLQTLIPSDYPDVIYIDPMFPATKKTAAVKKEMRVLKQLVGDDNNSATILRVARGIAKKRVVVKRRRYAPTIDAVKPDLVFEGKSSRFDVYLCHTASVVR